MSQPIFRWNGDYFGFIASGRLYDKYANYCGWVDYMDFWRRDGAYLGELVDNVYILKRKSMAPRANKPIRPDPPLIVAPPPCPNRMPRSTRVGFKDALDQFGS